MNTGEWVWSNEHQEICQVVDVQTLWGEKVCKIWLPTKNVVIRTPLNRLKSVKDHQKFSVANLAYIVAAARISDELTQNQSVLLAPVESSVIPLPHQIRALSKAVSNNRVRYLLADEVGLGKTIEAGLIMRELKLRGLIKRILVVAPKGLVIQWIAEMSNHFNESFKLIAPSEVATYRQSVLEENLWSNYNQVICSMDSVKPLDKRRGWSKQQIAEYNYNRFEMLISAGWDLIVVDESHRLAGSTDSVARYKLGQALSEASPYLLLLSATPHQGKTDAFRRLISLLDPLAFPDSESIVKEKVQPYVIRTEKRRAIDTKGQPLFKPRQTRLVPISWGSRYSEQQHLYEAVTEYVRQGYNQAVKEKKSYIGFLMILMQRLVTSSVRAIRTTLERRLEALQLPEEQLPLFPISLEEEWNELDTQDQLEVLVRTKLWTLKNEIKEVKHLIELAQQAETKSTDAKADALLEWIYSLQRAESNPELKFLIFTEFVATQAMLSEFLRERGIKVVCLSGAMGMDERKQVQEAFAKDARILIATDAGGEGLNLQFCHIIINYDIPWNPMRLEQRIGRVDRIGQIHTVQAINFVLEDTVEYRIQEVLEKKLAIILDEFWVDKTGDVLDSVQFGQIFDDLYVETILHPENIDSQVDIVINQVHKQAVTAFETTSILLEDKDLDTTEAQKLLEHPISHWIERMTTSYIEAFGGKVEKENDLWALTWPTGEKVTNASFVSKEDPEKTTSIKHLSLDDNKIRGLIMRLPYFAKGQPIPCISLSHFVDNVQGYWSLWQISINSGDWHEKKIFPLFINNNGRIFMPTARYIWEQLLSEKIELSKYVNGEEVIKIFAQSWEAAESQGKAFYQEMIEKNQERLMVERNKGVYAFSVRRRTIEKFGLPSVRIHRLRQLEKEEQKWLEDLDKREEIIPELIPLIIVHVEKSSNLSSV